MSKRPRESCSCGDEPQERGGTCLSAKGFDMSKQPYLRCCSDRSTKRTAAQHVEEKHLYLVVDDWERGYSIYRIDEDAFDSSLDTPLARMEAEHTDSRSLVAHGTKILAMKPKQSSTGIPAFDIETLGVSVYPEPRSRRDGYIGGKPVYASVGDRLMAFYWPFLEVLLPEAEPTTTSSTTTSKDAAEEPWSWTLFGRPPFKSVDVTSYTVHPDGRTVFLSLVDRDREHSTYTFDMESLEVTHFSEWILPFKGRAYYDGELDAWVGLCRNWEYAGRVCCCDVPPADGCEAMPAWKLGRDVLFDTERSQSDVHLGATLVHKGDGRFCLLESRAPTDGDPSKRVRVLKMDSFALKYDKDGDLRRTRHRAHAPVSYEVAHKSFDRSDNPVAFWI